MVYFINYEKALLFDTPINNYISKQLITHLRLYHIKINGIVINHFHEGCLGGLAAFHEE